MTLNGYFALNLSSVQQLMVGTFWLSVKIVQKLAELCMYFQGQKCSPGNAVSGSIRFVQIFTESRGFSVK